MRFAGKEMELKLASASMDFPIANMKSVHHLAITKADVWSKMDNPNVFVKTELESILTVTARAEPCPVMAGASVSGRIRNRNAFVIMNLP